MRPEDIRKTYKRESAASREEAASTAREVETDPEAARNLFQVVLAMSSTDREFSNLLHAIIESVVVDWIHNNMARDDEFALVIGRRITTLMDAMKPGWRPGLGRTNKTA